MITNFSEQLWIDFDVEIAVFLENLVAWIRFNASKDNPKDRNFHDGKYWSYNSYPQFARLFPGWSTKTMRTIVKRCVKNGLLIIGNFNKKNYDNTNWYTLTEKAWSYFPLIAKKLYPASSVDDANDGSGLNTPDQTGRPPAQTGRPIPLNPNHNINNINKENKTTTEQPHAPSSFKSDYCGKRANNNQTETKEPEQDANPIQDSITEAQDVVVFESQNKDKYVLNKIKDTPKENRPEYSTVKFLKEIKYHIEKHYPDNFHKGVNAVAKLLRKHKWSTPAGYVDVDAENARKTENKRLYQERMKAQEEMSEQKRKELYSALKCAKNEMLKRPVATKAFSSAIKSMYDVLGASRVLKNTQSGGSVFAQAS